MVFTITRHQNLTLNLHRCFGHHSPSSSSEMPSKGKHFGRIMFLPPAEIQMAEIQTASIPRSAEVVRDFKTCHGCVFLMWFVCRL